MPARRGAWEALRLAAAFGLLGVCAAGCPPKPAPDAPPRAVDPDDPTTWPPPPDPVEVHGSLHVAVDGPLLGGRTVTIEAVARAEDDFGEEFGIDFELPHDVVIVQQDERDARPAKAGESRTRRLTIQLPPDDIERRLVVHPHGAATEGAGYWGTREVLVINPGGRPRASWRCPPRALCEDGIPMDFEASGRLRPGATVDLVLRAVEVSEPYLVTLEIRLPPEVKVVSGATRKGPIAVHGQNQTEELKVRVALPNDGVRRKLIGRAGWESPSPDRPSGRRPYDFMPMTLETEGP